MSSNKRVLILAGDGIGPEVMGQVERVMEWLSARRSFSFDVAERACRRRQLRGARHTAHRRDPGGRGRGRRRPLRRGRRAAVGQRGPRGAAGNGNPAAPQGDGPLRQSAPGTGLRSAGGGLDAEGRGGARPRPDDRPRAHGRHLLRRAARRGHLARRYAGAASTPRSTARPRSNGSHASRSSLPGGGTTGCTRSRRPMSWNPASSGGTR